MKAASLAAASRLRDVTEAHPMLTFRPSPVLADFVNNEDDRLVLVRAANRAPRGSAVAGVCHGVCVPS